MHLDSGQEIFLSEEILTFKIIQSSANIKNTDLLKK